MSEPESRVLWFVGLGFFLFGCLVALYTVTALAFARYTMSDLDCPAPGGGDSVYGVAVWQRWPPGAVCFWEGDRFSGPSTASGTFIVVLAIALCVGAGALFVSRRVVTTHRPSPQPRPARTSLAVQGSIKPTADDLDLRVPEEGWGEFDPHEKPF